MVISPDVLVLPAFGADDADLTGTAASDELTRWLDGYDFSSTLDLQGSNADLHYTADGLAVTPTGMGKSAAAATLTAIYTTTEIDLSSTTLLTVGVAGAPPTIPAGSVVIADTIVDWDRKHRYDAEGVNPPIDLLSYRPSDYVWSLNADLVARVAAIVQKVDLSFAETVRQFHEEAGLDDPDPIVHVGPSVSGDEFWHGTDLADHVKWFCERYDVDGYVRTEMEDAGTAVALSRFDALDTWVSIRAIANYDRPFGHWSPAEGPQEVAYDLALRNAFRAGRATVSALLSN